MCEQILEKIKNLIAHELDVNLKFENIETSVPLTEGGLGLDSIAVFDLVCLIEDHFHFTFNESELKPANFQTLQTIADFILSRTRRT